ncbi:MAG: head GIN domain-containing protein [Pseudomonadota bacterium]
MPMKLGMVAAGGLVLGAMLLVSAAMVGGSELRNGNWANFDWGNWDGNACNITPAGKRGTRTLDWNAGDDIAINLPANVSYRRGQGEQIVIEGDTALLSHVQIDDNDLVLDCRLRNARSQRLNITLPGQEFRRFAVHGSANMVLEDLDQTELQIDISGSGDVTATGRAERLDFDVAGSGKGRFGNLDARDVNIDVAGSGDAEVAPRESLSVDIAGSGKVTLKTEPKTIDTSIAGSGRIIHVDGTVSRSSGLSRRSGDNDKHEN